MEDPNIVMTLADTATETLERVKIYSIIVGLFIVAFCVAPCVLFALLAKCFQKQRPHRKVRLNAMTSLSLVSMLWNMGINCT